MFLNVEADGLVQGMRKGTNAVDQFHRAQGRAASAFQAGSRSASRFGVLTQQAGYQVQDFAVQVAGGQSALVALSQQGSQMAGFFGPTGAIIGAALSVGVLTAQLIKATSATQETTLKFKDQYEALQDLIKARRELDIFNRPGAEPNYLSFDVSTAEKSVDAAQKQLDAANAANELASRAGSTMGVGGWLLGKFISEDASKATQAITEADAALKRAILAQERYTRKVEDQIEANRLAGLSETQKYEEARTAAQRMRETGDGDILEYQKLIGQIEEYERALKKITTENQRFGETGIQTLRRLADEMENLNENSIEYQEKLKEGRNILKGYENKASTILDKQDPLRALKRSAEEISDLLSLNLLNPEQAGRALDDLIKSPTLPSSSKIGGAMATGGFVGNADAAMQVQSNILDVLKEQRNIQKQLLMTWGGLN